MEAGFLAPPSAHASPVQTAQRPHWSEVAYHWHHYASPLRPHAADVRTMEAMVGQWFGQRRAGNGAAPPKALLLGVTPEIATMAWPEGTELLALDMSELMIRHVWPGDIVGRRKAICADWFEFPAGDDRFDVVIGDGNFTVLEYPRRYRALAAKIQAMVARDGILIIRHFIRPAKPETPQAVFADLLANRIASFHVFKFRLAMALQESAPAGVRMGDVHAAWKSAQVDVEQLMKMTGWSLSVIETIDLYDGKDSRLSFPRLDELDSVFGAHFAKLDERYHSYEMGERCPIVAYRPLS